jgi:hypothetical protein
MKLADPRVQPWVSEQAFRNLFEFRGNVPRDVMFYSRSFEED